MAAHGKFLFFVILALVASAGCCFHHDLTKTPKVQYSGILVQEYRTMQDLVLYKDKHSHTLQLIQKDARFHLAGQQVGMVNTGTRLQANQVVRITQLIGWMWFPVYYSWNCTLAKIETGPFAGSEVAIDGEGLSMGDKIATAGSPTLASEPSPAMLALYNPNAFSPAAKYDFYDSKGNYFATVTLVLPSPIMSEPFDGKWCSVAAKSYLPPNAKEAPPIHKFNVPVWNRLTCYYHPGHLSTAVINLNPNIPDDYIMLYLPISDKPVTGNWIYGTDAGEAGSGTFTGPHK